jgi:hypothetical protein
MSRQSISIQPLAGAIGAEIAGVDLAQQLDAETIAAIRQAWLDHLVIFFRDQELPPARLLALARRFGRPICWLESLRVLLAAAPAGDVVFTANSGHELGHLGLDDFIARRPGWDRPVTEGGASWVHYGANLGAVGGQLSLVSPEDDLRELAIAELAGAGQPPDTVAPKGLVPSGETRDIHRAGGRYLTLVASNPFFHLPQDRWPHAVDAAAVARIAAAMARLSLRLTR